MKKVFRHRVAAFYRLCAWAAAFAFAVTAALPVSAEQLSDISQVVSDAYVLTDAQTGQILVQKNAEKIKYPASITKIMTLALALQNGSLQDTITVSDTAVALDYNVSHVALQPGEVITVQDAVMATLLASANDAANCLAEYVSGSTEAFADLMNRVAQQIGCTNTHFVNANGLPDENHYTTAHDMARITAWALTVPGFREVFATDSYTMQATNLQPEQRMWATQNSMFVESKFQYEGAWGGKLGWTEEANHTMVTTLTCEGRDLILVTMDCQKKYQKYWDGICILDTALQALDPLTVRADTLAAAQVPVYSGETQTGWASYPQEELTVWAAAGTRAGQLELWWETPEKLEMWEDTAATLHIVLPENTLTEQEMTFCVGQGEVEEIPHAQQTAASVSVQETPETPREGGWRKAARIVGTVVLLAFCVRWYNLLRRAMRRKRRARHKNVYHKNVYRR